ncbi:MAG: hypothetical protein IJW26_01750 [Clostridia bacterium]|nr:hypothetical protein [Clostridia bacterium]
MFTISLILVGISMFLNGFLPIIDENDNNEIVVMNVISGILVTVFACFGILSAVDTATMLEYASLLLFSVTNLYISAVGIWDLRETSLGWFALIIAIISMALGVYYMMNANFMFGALWLIWSLIFVSYFVSRGLDVLHTLSNYVILIIGALCLVAVGILIFTGVLII